MQNCIEAYSRQQQDLRALCWSRHNNVFLASICENVVAVEEWQPACKSLSLNIAKTASRMCLLPVQS